MKVFLWQQWSEPFFRTIGSCISRNQHPFFAWTLIPDICICYFDRGPGLLPLWWVPLQAVLTGYAVTFNRRHRRHGQLFQNRYKSMRRGFERIKGDERILGEGDFVETVLKAAQEAQENLNRKSQLEAEGYSFDRLVGQVARQLEIKPKDVILTDSLLHYTYSFSKPWSSPI